MRLNIEYMFCQDREKYESDEKRKMKLFFTLMVGLCRDYIDGKKLGSFLKRDERIRDRDAKN